MNFTGTPNENSYIVYTPSAISFQVQQIDQTFTTDDIGIRLIDNSGGVLGGFYIEHEDPNGNPSPAWGFTDLYGKINSAGIVYSLPSNTFDYIVGDFSTATEFDTFVMKGISMTTLTLGDPLNAVNVAVAPASVFVDNNQDDIFLPDLKEGQFLFISYATSITIYIPRLGTSNKWGIYLTGVDKQDVSGYKTTKIPYLIVRKLDLSTIPAGSPYTYAQSHIEYDYMNQVSFWWNSKSIIRIGVIEQDFDGSNYNYYIDYSERDENNLLMSKSSEILNIINVMLYHI